jgi:hypothetical protein
MGMKSGGTKLPLWGTSSTLIVMMLIVNTIFRHVYESKRMLFNKVFISFQKNAGEIN